MYATIKAVVYHGEFLSMLDKFENCQKFYIYFKHVTKHPVIYGDNRQWIKNDGL